MDYIREALDKANASLDKSDVLLRDAPRAPAAPQRPGAVEAPAPDAWAPRQVDLKPSLLERNRIVAYSMSDPSHVPFNMLRTRVRKVMSDNNWSTFGITSPTPGCGKTMVAINLAMSLARGAGVRTVLIDLDLKKPSIARTLGIKPTQAISGFLRGNGGLEDCFVQIGSDLFIGLNAGHVTESSELIQSRRMDELTAFLRSTIRPDAIVFDLPPMGSGDDTLAFLPKLDAALLVVAGGRTTVAEVDDCERQISAEQKLLGIVLNKADVAGKDYYYY